MLNLWKFYFSTAQLEYLTLCHAWVVTFLLRSSIHETQAKMYAMLSVVKIAQLKRLCRNFTQNTRPCFSAPIQILHSQITSGSVIHRLVKINWDR